MLELLSSGHACDTYDAWSHERGCRVIVRTGDVRREGRLLRRLTHPNIVRVYEVHRDWMVLETLSGATLAALPASSATTRSRWAASSAARSATCTAQGWLHLDLKPDNLIADGGRLKLIDFSIAQRPGRVAPGTGTRRWMAPEQVRGGARHDGDRRVGDRRRAARGRAGLRDRRGPRAAPGRAGRDSMARWSPEPASGASATACARSTAVPFAPPHGQGLDELILTVLSQSTNDRNRDVAYLRAARALRGWEAVRDAPNEEVEAAIRPGGISKVKSARIQDDPARARHRSRSTGPHLRDQRASCVSLPGVGRKTAACVLLFAYGERDVPVDTHVSRVGTRLGLFRAEGAVRGAARRRCSPSPRAGRSSSST